MTTTRSFLALSFLSCLFCLVATATTACSSNPGDGAETSESANTTEAGADASNGTDGDTSATDGGAANEGGTSDGGGDANAFVDPRDGKSYRTLKIGAQTWFAQNLDHDLPGSSCYGNDPLRCAQHGRLYPWSTAPTACPPGAHLGSDAEWKALETSLGMAPDQLDIEGYASVRGVNEGTKLKDPTGFAATMAGFGTGASYDALGDRTYFWTASTRGAEVWRRRVAGATPTVFRFTNPPGSFAISVRCVVD